MNYSTAIMELKMRNDLTKLNPKFFDFRTELLIEMIYIYYVTFGSIKQESIMKNKSNEEYEELINRLNSYPEEENPLIFRHDCSEYRKLKNNDPNDEYYLEKFEFIADFVHCIPHFFFITHLYRQPVYYNDFGIFEELKKWLASMSVIVDYSKFPNIKKHGIELIGFNLNEAAKEVAKIVSQCYRFRCASQQRPYTPDDENNLDADFYEWIRFHYWNYKITGTERDDHIDYSLFPVER